MLIMMMIIVTITYICGKNNDITDTSSDADSSSNISSDNNSNRYPVRRVSGYFDNLFYKICGPSCSQILFIVKSLCKFCQSLDCNTHGKQQARKLICTSTVECFVFEVNRFPFVAHHIPTLKHPI